MRLNGFSDGFAGDQLMPLTPAAGIVLSSKAARQTMARLSEAITLLFADDAPHSFTAPPVIASSVIERTGYAETFPHLMGSVASATCDPDRPDLVLTPAACHHIYPLLQDQHLDRPATFAVDGVCFRDEATSEPGRLRSFTMQELVHAGPPEECLAWRDKAMHRAERWLRSLGLTVGKEIANDPFFGPGAALLRSSQREQELKWELLTLVGGDAEQAIASCNHHKDRFSKLFGFRQSTGGPTHTACLGFGLDRLVMALAAVHGPDPATWPVPRTSASEVAPDAAGDRQ